MKHSMHRRAVRPQLERFEDRALLSSSALLAFQRSSLISTGASAKVAAIAPGTTAATPTNSLLNPTGNPTPHELARERFRATFNGPYVIGNGRFDTQSMLINVRGAGRDTYSLHADVQIGLVVLKDPTQPITGTLVINDRNTSSNTVVGLDLTADPSSVDRFGRPTHFTFTNDNSLSAGVFANAISSGTVDIHYNGSVSRRGPIRGSGNATVVVSGLAYTPGGNNVLRNANLYG